MSFPETLDLNSFITLENEIVNTETNETIDEISAEKEIKPSVDLTCSSDEGEGKWGSLQQVH